MVEDFGKRALSGRVHHVIKYVMVRKTGPHFLVCYFSCNPCAWLPSGLLGLKSALDTTSGSIIVKAKLMELLKPDEEKDL